MIIIIIPIFKNKGSKTEIKNFRPIALTIVGKRIFEKIIDSKLQNYKDMLHTSQGGFLKKRSTLHQVYYLMELMKNNPDLVQQDGILAFKSAIWFWMMPQWPIPSCHQIMHELWEALPGEYTQNKMYQKGFAHTTNIINGITDEHCSSVPTSTKVLIKKFN